MLQISNLVILPICSCSFHFWLPAKGSMIYLDICLHVCLIGQFHLRTTSKKSVIPSNELTLSTARMSTKPIVLKTDNITAFVGASVTLECTALSDSTPHFQWRRWFSSIENGSRNHTFQIMQPMSTEPTRQTEPRSSHFRSSAFLGLVNVTQKDSGRYTCVVGNSLGRDQRDIYVDILKRTGKLYKFIVIKARFNNEIYLDGWPISESNGESQVVPNGPVENY